ncbi:DUF1877 family protein [Kitasatospora sp. NPDC085879]|uniref:DUF1877 family protein n=1 Tax=Kitasatospora sp. NPDC085879 TaxID=3154769 RepID=UPI00341AE4AA
MALTQQLARVSPEYLDRCRRAAADSADGDPRWDPPAADLLDLEWAAWGLERYLRRTGAAPGLADTLDRATSGDGSADIAFLDHVTVYDGFGDPPALLAPDAVAGIVRALDAVDTAEMLARLPRDPSEAARICGFDGFRGDLAAHLLQYFDALRDFCRGAAARRLAIVVWVD